MCRKSVNLIQPIFLRFIEGGKAFLFVCSLCYTAVHIYICIYTSYPAKLRLRGSLVVITNSPDEGGRIVDEREKEGEGKNDDSGI